MRAYIACQCCCFMSITNCSKTAYIREYFIFLNFLWQRVQKFCHKCYPIDLLKRKFNFSRRMNSKA